MEWVAGFGQQVDCFGSVLLRLFSSLFDSVQYSMLM